ncbi:trans-1,2-dihydrobenzene-1,2-diol dehydrogenase-like [Plodia interpunctella]|uniref:trans-1,2-dihydrobenzene-1,2-diol dehydrogenase-like n=1 Tax=Plodia interpunctella TaxID=58824 RepID=UPI002368D87A|nr:trans-1,2-dihydrobenzene-1,2-diol dehydrogenase-like isoform X1 [Plodia interpunctella]
MTVRWGIVCAGKICHDFVNAVNSYPNKGDQVIAAIAARNKERATEFAKLHKIPKVYDSYEALAASADIDIAYIGALNPDHYALSKLFLEHGKHVLCEKPLCLNFKQAQSIIKLAEKKKLFFMEGVWSRFAPSYVALEKDIKDGKLGEVKFVEVNLGVPMANVDRISKKELGGSVVLDIGVYVLQLSQFVFKDEPVRVSVIGEPLNESGVDLMETIVLDYKDGRRAVLNINAHIKMWNKATIYGTKGRYTLEENFNFSTALTREGGKTEYFPLHESPLPYNFDNSAGLVYETLEVVRCIKNGLIESPRMSHKESLTLAKLEDEVRRQIGVHFDADDQDYP